MKIKISEIKLKIKILDDKKTKAIIGLDFGDFVVRGFRIIESKFPNLNGDMLWLTPPSYLGGGRYHPIFYLPNKDYWLELEKRIYMEYQIANDEHFKKRLGIKDKDLEDI